jgi:hypothetical protein
MSDERDLLLRRLDGHRQHVLGAIDGLTDEQLRHPVLPSGWHCLGLLQHLTLADEHYWFRSIVGGEPLDFFPAGPNAEWVVEPDVPVADVIAAYRDEIARSNAVILRTDLDDPPRQRDPRWDEWGIDFPDLRYIMLHMIGETACHAGHVDAVRELIDGRQWIVM